MWGAPSNRACRPCFLTTGAVCQPAALPWELQAMRLRTAPWLLAVFLLTTASASAEEVSDLDRFQLWNGCQPIAFYIGQLSDDAREIGLREEDVAVVVRSRLRGSRIYSGNILTHLLVNASVYGPAFSIDVTFHRRAQVLLPLFLESKIPEGTYPLIGHAITWDSGSTGTHGSTGAAFVLSRIALHIDRFIDEYLRVNSDACQ